MDRQFNAVYFSKQAHGDGVGVLILKNTWLSINGKKIITGIWSVVISTLQDRTCDS